MNEGQEQLLLLADSAPAKRAAKTTRVKKTEPAKVNPIARVRVDVSIAHLDRDFDYVVPSDLDDQVSIGCKVRVRFNRALTDAIVIDRIAESEFSKLSSIERVIGPALTPETLSLVQSVCQRYAGLFWDVVRAAVPKKHGRIAAGATQLQTAASVHASESGEVPDSTCWDAYDNGTNVLAQLMAGETVRGCWSSAPATDWRREIRGLIDCIRYGNGEHHDAAGILILVPDVKDVRHFLELMGDLTVEVLTAELGEGARYKAFQRIYAGVSRVVIGTRSAVFAPVANLKAIVMWDDGNDTYSDPHAPYWDAREVAALRSHESACSLLVGNTSRSVVTQSWCESGWATDISPSSAAKKRVMGRVRAVVPEDAALDPAQARIPRIAWQAAQKGLITGPVLIQVARKGYIPVIMCLDCGVVATCKCGGAIQTVRHGTGSVTHCIRCGIQAWRCSCGGNRTKALSIGAERTAEEIGRAFPGTPILWSQADRLIDHVDSAPRIVVATPGAEPMALGGYSAVIVLDASTSAPSLLAQESLMRRFFNAAVLGSPSAHVVIVAPAVERAVQAVTRWDARWAASRELSERREAHLPPSTRFVRIDGARTDVVAFIDSIQSMMLANGHAQRVHERDYFSVLGPIDHANLDRANLDRAKLDRVDERQVGDTRVHAFLAVNRSRGSELSRHLLELTRVRSTDSKCGHVQVRVDPRDF